ncbi:HAMP domain-containing protein [Paenibacillus sp. V4I9]|uniref:HAMP domain-containing sensor histidine kinase n=1 Tax=Paenibacillus sp. V4I9 TaxID=3042308 RepID=UPI00278B47D9|nr:ATP-binding protein [Paenibacillus sp. V4I9]MDQ0886533.1 HAMP domain-containing protein [Paenibacillus sp. V4I9]
MKKRSVTFSQIAILDENGAIKFSPAYEIVVETIDKTKLKILLNNIVYLEGFQNLKLTMGSQIEVEGIFHDKLNQIIYLSSIKNDTEKWGNSNLEMADVTTGALIEGTLTRTSQTTIPQQAVINKEPITAEMSELLPLKKISGKIIALDIPTQISQMGSYSRGLLGSSIDYWKGLQLLNKIKIEPGKTSQFHCTNPSNGMDNIVFVRPVRKENGTSSEYVFAISFLQPVGEAVDVLRDYYFYAFLVALLFIAVMALLFSKIISKPLIKMTQVATRMASLDFSEEVPVKSMDEFGSMAISLNRLSKNLGTINEKKIKLKLENEREDIKVFGDVRRLEQVVTNILTNAIRHSYYEGFIQIDVQQLQNSVCISVENSGEQIGDDDLKLIWDRFYRAEKSRDRKTGGTGLGLSIVKNILEMHGSWFGVENTKHGVIKPNNGCIS